MKFFSKKANRNKIKWLKITKKNYDEEEEKKAHTPLILDWNEWSESESEEIEEEEEKEKEIEKERKTKTKINIDNNKDSDSENENENENESDAEKTPSNRYPKRQKTKGRLQDDHA